VILASKQAGPVLGQSIGAKQRAQAPGVVSTNSVFISLSLSIGVMIIIINAVDSNIFLICIEILQNMRNANNNVRQNRIF
jgi:hypothetical protein